MNLDSVSGTVGHDAAARIARRHTKLSSQSHSQLLSPHTARTEQIASALIVVVPSNELKEQRSKSAARDKYERILHRASSMEVGPLTLQLHPMA